MPTPAARGTEQQVTRKQILYRFSCPTARTCCVVEYGDSRFDIMNTRTGRRTWGKKLLFDDARTSYIIIMAVPRHQDKRSSIAWRRDGNFGLPCSLVVSSKKPCWSVIVVRVTFVHRSCCRCVVCVTLRTWYILTPFVAEFTETVLRCLRRSDSGLDLVWTWFGLVVVTKRPETGSLDKGHEKKNSLNFSKALSVLKTRVKVHVY